MKGGLLILTTLSSLDVRENYLWAVSRSPTIFKTIIASLVIPAAHVIALLVPLSSVTPVGIVAGLVRAVPPTTFCATNPKEVKKK